MNHVPSTLQKLKLYVRRYFPQLMTGFIVTVSLLVTYAFWSTSQQKITHKLESNFDNKVNQTIGLIERRMASYEQILKGVQGLFVSSVSVERDEFNQYVKNLNLENTYPGIQGIGYAIKLSKEQIEKHLTQMHKYGFLDYKIQPEGPREYVVPIIYMEPLTEINRKVLGLDPYAMTIPKKAMIIAQDNDIATVSGKITLEQDRGAADKFGFVMYLPVYKNGVPHDSLEDRRKHIVGWIDAPFRARDLIDAIVGESSSDISLKVYDGELISKQTLLYTSSTASENCQFNASNIIQLGGRIWTVEMCSLPSFGQTVTDNEPRLVAYTGMIMSALLGLLIWSMTTGHARALSLAARMTEELRTSAERWKLALDGSGDGVWDWDIQTNEVHFSPRWKEMLGFSDNEIGMSFNEWESRVHPDDLEQAKQTVKEYLQGERSYYTNEIRMQCKDGRWKWILSRGMAVSYDEGKKPLRLIGTHTDITQRKTIEQREKSQNKVLELILNGASLEESLTAIVNEVELVNPSMICSILLLDKQGERLSIGAAPGLPDFYNKAIDGIEIGPEVGSCGTAAFTKQRVIVEDIHSHPYWSPYTELAKKADLGACWSQPIITLENTILGCFAIYHRSTMVPTDDDIKLIEDASKLAGIAIERHYAQEAQQLASTVYKNSSEGIVITNRENVIIAINPAFTELTGYSESEVVGQSPKILSSGKQNNQFYQMMWEELNNSGRWQGEIWNKRKNGEEYVEWLSINTIYDDDENVYQYVALFSDITEKKKNEQLIWTQANYDSLTQLPNRRMFRDRLQQEVKKCHRSDSLLALFFIDLDHFKEVNDTLGHDLGDKLLIEAARRIESCVRTTDTVARLGGDEFTVILSELDDLANIERVASAITEVLRLPFNLANELAYVSASIGITIYPDDTIDTDDLVRNADQAMYLAKDSGRNRFSYFTKSMQEKALYRQHLLNDLHFALEEQQFELYYQPIIDLTTGEIIKAEALLRWHHPVRGLVSPVEFIPLAEESGMIVEIGNWVFKEAARQASLYQKKIARPLQISINKSPVQFHMASDHSNWSEYLKEINLPGESIVIEITEGLLMNKDSHIDQQLVAFHKLGMQIAVDDFGTGYSSLSYLSKFDIDYLKIDQSFVQNLTASSDELSLCEAIIVMAHKLGLKVIAEGIETEQQKQLLSNAGCDFGQGYLFAKPLPAKEFEKLLI